MAWFKSSNATGFEIKCLILKCLILSETNLPWIHPFTRTDTHRRKNQWYNYTRHVCRMKNGKGNSGYQISKHFSRQLLWTQIPNFSRVQKWTELLAAADSWLLIFKSTWNTAPILFKMLPTYYLKWNGGKSHFDEYKYDFRYKFTINFTY